LRQKTPGCLGRRHQSLFSSKFRIAHIERNHLVPADNVHYEPEEKRFTACFASITLDHNYLSSQTAPETLETYLSTLPEERRRFLALCRPHGDFTEKLALDLTHQAIKERRLFEIAPDGGLSEGKGTFGVVLAQGEIELWEVAGPVDGDPDTSNSKRSELAGYAASLELILLIVTILPLERTTKMHTKTWIDSSAAGRHLSNLLANKKTRISYPHDPDLLSHIQWLWQRLSMVKHNIGWVKSHQDSKAPYHQLPRNAQLNILADSLATEFLTNPQTTRYRPKANPFFFPSCRISLTVNGQRVTAFPQEAIRFHINGTRLRQHYQKTNRHWEDSVWKTIDITGLGSALKSTAIPKRFQICKMMHGWFNTGQQRTKIDPLALGTCPCCGDPCETFEHILMCRDPRMRATRYNEMILLRSTIVTKLGGSHAWLTLHQCLLFWIHNNLDPPSTVILKQSLPAKFMPILSQAITEQTKIGWSMAFRGFLSSTWLHAQLLEHPRSTITGLRRQWLQQIIKANWRVSLALWDTRNGILHSTQANVQQIRESLIDAKVRLIYLSQDTFAATDQILFDLPLEIRLQKSSRDKRHWLSLVARYHPTTIAGRIGNQPLITQFFGTSVLEQPNNQRHPKYRFSVNSS
jgi:hypothetical protein